MKAKAIFALTLTLTALVATIAVLLPRTQSANREPEQPDTNLSSKTPDSMPQPTIPEAVHAPKLIAPAIIGRAITPASIEKSTATTNKLERLTQIRETFRSLAAGDPTTALRAAKEIMDGTERETALLTLVTEWTRGELRPPRSRAQAIDLYGLEAGLGIELAKNPELAVLWANEMTDGSGRAAVLQQTAIATIDSEPAAAFALIEQLPQEDRRKFFDSVFAGWAEKDTDAAMQWADQLPDPSERDSAIQAIRSVAPVGIGAVLKMQEGYPVINGLLPGTPAELSGQIHSGDRIVALAQGDNSFVDAHSLSLQEVVQLIRGAPGTQLQLQLLPADAPPNSPPRTVSVIREQLKFKR